MSFKNETEKIVLLQVKGLIQIIVKFRTEKKFVHIFIMHDSPFERGTNELKVYNMFCKYLRLISVTRFG